MLRHQVCDLSDLPVGGRVVTRLEGDISVGIFNVAGEIVAFRNHCPHAGAPICVGTLGSAVLSSSIGERHLEHEGCILKCPWHAWEFKLPEGITLTEPPLRLRRYHVVVEEGHVFIEVRPPGPHTTAEAAV